MTTTLMEQETVLNRLIESGQTEQAIKLLCQLAVACARNNAFEKADNYRDQIYEVDSMALSAIVRVNELIESEKSRALTPDRRRLWARFFEGLSSEEANAFFFALKEQTHPADTTILHQGKGNERLYLVEKGQLKIVHEREDKQQLIQTIGSGDVVGEDTFFSINVCTGSVTTLSQVKLSYLERERLEGIKIQHPMIEQHLQKICGTGGRIYNWLRRKGMDRRSFHRINLSAPLWFQVLSSGNGGSLQRPVAGELWDISKCGLSFYFQSKKRETVQRLVGRTIGVRFKLDVKGKKRDVALTGIVQGVQDHPLDEYSVHVMLRKRFSDEAMKTIRQVAEAH